MVLKPNIKKDLGYLIIENLYSDSELKFIWNEIKHIDYVFDKVFDDEKKEEHRKTHNGTNKDGIPLMSGFGLSLDTFYSNREFSSIISASRKILDKEVVKEMITINNENTAYELVNEDFTLLNKYKTGESYKKHRDSSSFSSITFLCESEIKDGGIKFSDYDVTIPFKNNSCVIFPSRVYHETESFISKTERYSIAQFMNIKYFVNRNV